MATVQIKIAGTDRTDDVLFSSARFMSAVNGVAGEASFRIRDLTSSLSIAPGQTLELLIDGDPVWTGWIMQAKRIYVFPALNPADFGSARFFDVIGSDLNLLFAKRIVANYGAGTEENVLAPLYGAHTADTTAITDLLADWLDLSGDSLDTSSDVHNVGDINEDQKARAWEGSDTWGQAMTSIAALPAAIFYLRPNRKLAYVDTDTPDAPFGLSDQPDGTTSKGYREMEILLDGTNLANDVLAWGIGYGSTVPVFKRDEDATSQSDHGLWQLGQTTFGVYKQATIDRIADSILNGSPDHHRGAKDDRHAVTVTTFEPGLLPAQKVTFESHAFGWSEVLPIRRMEVTFPTPDAPRYELTLSQEIDTPWSFYDPFRYHLPTLPGLHLPPFPPLPIPETPGGCTGCGITDFGFGRDEDGDWGTSDSGLVWQQFDGSTPSPTPGISYSVTNGVGTVTTDDVSIESGSIDLILPLTEYTVEFLVLDYTTNDFFGYIDLTSPGLFSSHWVSFDSGASELGVSDGSGNFDSTTFSFDGTPFRVKIEFTNSGTQVKAWLDGDPEPGWLLSVTAGDRTGLTYALCVEGDGAQFDGTTISISGLEIRDLDGNLLNRCSQFMFENFDRPDQSGWGTSTDGHTWSQNLLTGAAWSIDAFRGIQHLDAGTTNQMRALTSDGGGWASESWTMTLDFVPTFGTGGAHTILDIVNHGDLRVTGLDLDIANSLFSGSASGSPSTAFTYTSGTLYHVVWEMVSWVGEAQHWRAKIYADGDPDPGWMLDYTNASRTPQDATNYLIVYSINQSSGSDYEIAIDFIDFDYTGKPCYLACASSHTTFDFFGRDIDRLPSNGPPRDIGVATFGWPYTWSSGPGHEVHYGVDASTHVYYVDALNDGTLSAMVQHADGAGGPWDDGWWLMTTRVRFLGAVQTTIPQVVYFQLDNATQFLIEMSSTVGQVRFASGDSAAKTDWIAGGEWYSVKWEYVSAGQVSPIDGATAVERAKVWAAASEPEPDWQISQSASARRDGEQLRIGLSGIYERSEVGGIAFAHGECTTIDSTPHIPAGPAFGPFTEIATRIDATHYQLTRTVSPGTLQVSVGSPGALLDPATDYTVTPSTGVVELTDPVASGTQVSASYTAAGPLPTEFATGAILTFPGGGPSTQEAFLAALNNLAYDIIEMEGMTYQDWNLSARVSRASRPLTIRPAPGADVIWDGSGLGSGCNGPLFFGANPGASGFPSFVTDYITFDPTGTGGSFTIQNYDIGHTGLILTGWVDHLTFNRFQVVNCSGSGGSFSHCLYINSDHNDVPYNAGHHATNVTANDWYIVGDAGRTLNGLQTYHNPNVIGLTALNWSVDSLNRWAFLDGDASGIMLAGWDGTNCNATIDSTYSPGTGDTATGTVANCTANGSCGPLAEGSGSWANAGIVDGGGNVA